MEQLLNGPETQADLLMRFISEEDLSKRSDTEIQIALIYLSRIDLSDTDNQRLPIDGINALLDEAEKRDITLIDDRPTP